MAQRSSQLTSVPVDDATACLVEEAGLAIGRLDARLSASPVASAWFLRAAWTGYASALQLQRMEIDEIDVFAWGCGVQVPGRARLTTVFDPLEQFEPWRRRLADGRSQHWREGLGALVRPDPEYAGPRLIRALEALRQISLADRTIETWLAAPLLLARIGVTTTALPCLVIGKKRLRFGQPADPALLRRLLKGLSEAAATGLARLEAMERDRERAARAIAAASRAGALPRLAAYLQVTPVISPQALTRKFGLTIAGAGKLLIRAAAAGLVREVRGKHAWKLYLVPDLATALGLAAPVRGRPRSEPPPRPFNRAMSELLAAFDEEVGAFDRRWAPSDSP